MERIHPNNSNDMANLPYISNLCPYMSGPDLFKARVLLSALTDTIDFPDDQFCNGPPQKNEKENKSETQNSVNVYPNPAKQEVTFSIHRGAISLIRIYDSLGSLVNSIKPSKHERQFHFTLTSGNAGIYEDLFPDCHYQVF